MVKLTNGWRSWPQNTMIQYLQSGADLKIRFKCRDGHAGWTKPLTGDVDQTIRQQLRDLSNGKGD